MNYSQKQSHCRVDFFKESGKWYETEEVIFPREYYKNLPVGEGWLHPIDKFKKILESHLGINKDDGTIQYRMQGMIAICLDPYFEDNWPLMIKIPEMGEW